ncbi:hypothetical protein V1278_000129 [Bradyrhizobium sp. AZCC 1577]
MIRSDAGFRVGRRGNVAPPPYRSLQNFSAAWGPAVTLPSKSPAAGFDCRGDRKHDFRDETSCKLRNTRPRSLIRINRPCRVAPACSMPMTRTFTKAAPLKTAIIERGRLAARLTGSRPTPLRRNGRTRCDGSCRHARCRSQTIRNTSSPHWRMWLNRRTDVWSLPAVYVAVDDAEEGAIASSFRDAVEIAHLSRAVQ